MDRRTLLTGGGTLLVAATLARNAHARFKAAELTHEDSHFMQLAIDQAKEADYPFGAVIVEGQRVLALGRNSSKRNTDPTAHAEMVAIRAFLSGHEPQDFKRTTLYASGVPDVHGGGHLVRNWTPRLRGLDRRASDEDRPDQHHVAADSGRDAVRRHGDRGRPVVRQCDATVRQGVTRPALESTLQAETRRHPSPYGGRCPL